MQTIKIVDVQTREPITSATLHDDGTVAYGDTLNVAESVVRSRMHDIGHGGLAAAFDSLATDGWSNGYLMVELPGVGG